MNPKVKVWLRIILLIFATLMIALQFAGAMGAYLHISDIGFNSMSPMLMLVIGLYVGLVFQTLSGFFLVWKKQQNGYMVLLGGALGYLSVLMLMPASDIGTDLIALLVGGLAFTLHRATRSEAVVVVGPATLARRQKWFKAAVLSALVGGTGMSAFILSNANDPIWIILLSCTFSALLGSAIMWFAFRMNSPAALSRNGTVTAD